MHAVLREDEYVFSATLWRAPHSMYVGIQHHLN